MKILHTADWHIGAKLNGVSRQAEQQAVLDEIVDIATTSDVDIVLVCGDVFHDAIYASYADKLLLDTLVKLSDNGRRAVVVLLGNRDSGDRLTSSKNLAERENIFFVNSLNYDYGLEFHNYFDVNLVACGKGYLKFRKGDEEAVINLMPYPSQWFRKETTLPGETQIQKIHRLYSCGTLAFETGTINISIGHFFVPTKRFPTDIYREIMPNVIPDADYTALGHIHDISEVSAQKNIIFSGSPYQIYPTDSLDKFVVVVTMTPKGVTSKEYIKIRNSQKIVIINATDYQDCVKKLSAKRDCLAVVNVHNDDIALSDIKKIQDRFENIITFNIIPKIKRTFDISKRNMKPKDIFIAFYQDKKEGIRPKIELINTFEEVLKGGTDETD